MAVWLDYKKYKRNCKVHPDIWHTKGTRMERSHLIHLLLNFKDRVLLYSNWDWKYHMERNRVPMCPGPLPWKSQIFILGTLPIASQRPHLQKFRWNATLLVWQDMDSLATQGPQGTLTHYGLTVQISKPACISTRLRRGTRALLLHTPSIWYNCPDTSALSLELKSKEANYYSWPVSLGTLCRVICELLICLSLNTAGSTDRDQEAPWEQ